MSQSTSDQEAHYWREKYKAKEVYWMSLKDDYSDLARAAGLHGCGFWGDPLESHDVVVSRIRQHRKAHGDKAFLVETLTEIIERLDQGQTAEPRDVAELALQAVDHQSAAASSEAVSNADGPQGVKP